MRELRSRSDPLFVTFTPCFDASLASRTQLAVHSAARGASRWLLLCHGLNDFVVPAGSSSARKWLGDTKLRAVRVRVNSSSSNETALALVRTDRSVSDALHDSAIDDRLVIERLMT
jgi:hypothetical protein